MNIRVKLGRANSDGRAVLVQHFALPGGGISCDFLYTAAPYSKLAPDFAGNLLFKEPAEHKINGSQAEKNFYPSLMAVFPQHALRLAANSQVIIPNLEQCSAR